MPRRLPKTKESKDPKEGDKLHPVKLKKQRKKAPDGSDTYVAEIGANTLATGRVKDPTDDRDYIASSLGPVATDAAVLPTYKYWGDNTWRGDQDGTSQCAAYSGLHRVENSPLTYTGAGPVVAPKVIYDRAQAIDEWPGADYEGTSCRAAAAALKERGFLSEYQRLISFESVIEHLRRPASLEGGPVVIGIDWFEDMFALTWMKDALGTYRWMLSPTGAYAGGHALLVNGVNVPRKIFRLLNSWGTGWGISGRAWMRFSDMENLLFNQGGDVWRYQEVRPGT